MNVWRSRIRRLPVILGTGYLVILFSIPAGAQVKNKGIPPIINYPKKVYGGGTQTWSITQDNRGFMYFGNNDGLLEFDGAFWKKYALPDLFLYRSVMIAADGTIYIGISNEFGYMKPDSTGSLTYCSISHDFRDITGNFNDIWRIVETPGGIYFQSKSKIFFYHDKILDVILPEKEFNYLFKAGESLYTSERQSGLVVLDGLKIYKASGGDFFSGLSIESVIQFDENRVVIGTAKNGLFLYDGKKAVPWAPEASRFLEENSLFCGTALTGKYFAYGSIRDGIVLIDKSGKPVQHLNQARGLQNNTVLCAFCDRDNNLWLGLDNGITFIETNSPITYYNYGKSLPGTGYASVLANGMLYGGTNQGLYVKKWKDYEDPLDSSEDFIPVPGTQGQVWSLRLFDSNLLCGHNLGTFIIKGKNASLISDIPGGWDYMQIDRPDIILGGTYTGISIFRKTGDQIRMDGTLKGFNESTRLFTQDPDGSIWVSHGTLGVFNFTLAPDLNPASRIRLYTEADGLPSRYRNSVFRIGKQILFTTISGVYYFDKQSGTFKPEPSYASVIGTDPVSSLIEDNDGNIWFFKETEIGIIHTVDGKARSVEKRPFYPLKTLINRSYENVYSIDEQNIIIACEEGFAHYDPTFPVKYPEMRKCYIRSVTGRGKKARLFFGGTSTMRPATPASHETGTSRINIPFAFNTLQFEFAVPVYDNSGNMLFSYRLEGLDDYPSDWTKVSTKEYTRLKEGHYTFLVRGKSIYNDISDEATFNFRILPPWYRSVPAIAGYAFLLSALLVLLIRRIIRKNLQAREETGLKIEHELGEMRKQLQADLLESEKRMVMIEKEKLEVDMENKNKQLASTISGLVRKNEFLLQLKADIQKISSRVQNPSVAERLKKIISRVDKNLEADSEYEQFEDHFDAVHDNFLKSLKKSFPQLTPKDLRLCAYLRINLTTKEIAPLLNISPRGVEISRYRLRKKMKLPHDANLVDIMINI